MNKRLALLVAVIMGLLAVVLIHIYIKNIQRNANKGMEEITVLVAAEDLEKGAPLTDKKVAYRPYPKKYVADRAIEPLAAGAAMGAQLKVNIEKGKPIFWSDLVTRADLDAGLAGDLQPNMCAMTIPVTAISGLAGLLSPGMRVDILLTIGAGCMQKSEGAPQLPPEAAAGMASADVNTLKATLTAPPKVPAGAPTGDDKKKVTALLLQDILVLATGAQRIGMPAPARGAGEQNMYNSVTLMLARKEAQMLTLCLTQGQINLLLRKAGETGKVADVPPVSCADLPDFLAQ